MTTVNIEVVDATVQTVPKKNGKGTYDKCTVTYKTQEGKVDSKDVFDWVVPEVFKTCSEMKKGDTFSIDREKDANGYWVWKEVHRQDMPVTIKKEDFFKTPTKPTYETPEERARRQVLIVKQSSLTAAINSIQYVSNEPEIEDIIELAKRYADWVLGE